MFDEIEMHIKHMVNFVLQQQEGIKQMVEESNSMLEYLSVLKMAQNILFGT